MRLAIASYSIKRLIGCILAPALMLASFISATAQQPVNFTAITVRDGLSSNNIKAIIKDHTGVMWFATEDGLNKYDGIHFTVYRNVPGDSTSLPVNEILTVYEDKAGNLWVGTGGGALSLYNRQTDNFSHYPAGGLPRGIRHYVVNAVLDERQGRVWVASFAGINIIEPKNRQILEFSPVAGKVFSYNTLCLFEDKAHSLWIGTDSGLFVWNAGTRKLKHFAHERSSTNSLPSNTIRAIKQDGSGNIWLGTDGGLCSIDPAGKLTIEPAFAMHKINALAANPDGNLWAGTESGVSVLNTINHQVKHFKTDTRNLQSLSGKSISAIYFDPQGTGWFGSERNGISKYDKNLNLFNLISSNAFDNEGLPAPVVTSFADAADSKVYVGTDGGGVTLFDPATGTFERIKLVSERKGSNQELAVLTLLHTSSNQLLAGTYADGLFVIEPATRRYLQLLAKPNTESLTGNDVFAIFEDSRKNVWVGSNGQGITVFDKNFNVVTRYMPKPELAKDIAMPVNGFIRDFAEDKNGNIWIATFGSGLAMLNPANNSFKSYNLGNNGLPSDKVQSVLIDHRGNIWAGTMDGGLGLLNATNQRFTTYTEKDGLINNNIFKLLEDDSGRIWHTTNRGLGYFDPSTKKFSSYGPNNGLQYNSFVHGAGLKASNGYLYFGGLDGFNYLNPKYLVKNTIAPPIIFTELKIANQAIFPSAQGPISENISTAKEINLDFKQNFSLSFVALNYSAPMQNQYAHILEGFDRDWNYTGSINTVSYTNLDPGVYTLRVKASNNDGVWNNTGIAITIIVHPPFWRTNLAYLLYVMAFAGGFLYFRYKAIQKIKAKYRREQERRELQRIHELDRLKIKFLTNLSHEFRTPISLILGPLDTLLKQRPSTERLNEQLYLIKRNARRLLNLVNQLLDFRKMEEQELKLNAAEGEVVSFVQEVSDSFKDLAERKKIEFSFTSSVNRLYSIFDHDKIERVLFNLLSNAFKFTLEGGKISLAMQHADDHAEHHEHAGESWILFKISDTGIGIPADKQAKIFDRFFQNNTDGSILNQGTGIGLSITKEFVKMLGGNIEVESTPGEGSTFIVTIPFTRIEEREPELQTSNDEPADELLTDTSLHEIAAEPMMEDKVISNKPVLLLVEDNDDFRFYLKDNLRSEYKVIEASDGREGWQKALAQHPQLIVSDISMPNMDGIDFCKKVKSDKRTSHIPVILLTALTGEKEQLRGLETGANDYITKPFNFELLHAKLKNLLILNDTFKATYSRQIKMVTPEVTVISGDQRLLNDIMVYLEENLTDTQLSVESLSRHVGMSRVSLYNKLLDITGQTPVEFIRSVKLEKAAELLRKSDMTIAQVAYSAGFATPNYFTKSFKAKYNMLPSEYIARNKKQQKDNEAG